jgi:hypothetical protein
MSENMEMLYMKSEHVTSIQQRGIALSLPKGDAVEFLLKDTLEVTCYVLTSAPV